MDLPGLSLFQGGGSIHVDGRAAEEEAEELLDRKRRENELGKELQNAFDDLLAEDEDETMDHSYQSVKRHYLDSDRVDHRDDGHGDSSEELYRLRIELQSKTNEVAHLNKVLAEERQVNQKRISDLTKKLALAEAEQERLQMVKNQTHELLVESKTKICDLDDLLGKLRERTQQLETEKSTLSVDLENARIMLNDAQLKCRMMEKEIGRGGANNSRQEAAMRQMGERNTAQLELMQQQIDNLRDKLEARDLELRTCRDLQKAREQLLIEKSDTINELTERLEQAQRKCQEKQLDGYKRSDAREDFANVMESTPHVRKKPHLGMEGLRETDELAKEVAALKQDNADKATEIQQMIVAEGELKAQLQRLQQEREVAASDCAGCRVAQGQLSELMAVNRSLSEANVELQETNKRIMAAQEEDSRVVVEKLQELKVLQQLLADQKLRLDEAVREKDQMAQHLHTERQKMKEISENSLKCMQQMREATQMEVKNLQLQNDCMGYLKNLRGLRAASQLLDGMAESRTTTASTSSSTTPTGRECGGGGGKEFCDRSVMVCTPSDLSPGAATTTTELTSPQRTAIIEEYAKLSAAQIKRVEEKYRAQVVVVQEELATCQRELETLRRTYVEETHMFKEAILAERDEYERLLEEKERELRAREEEVQRCKERLSAVGKKSARDEREEELLDSLTRELRKKQEEMDEERLSMQLMRSQWKEERKQLLAIEEHLKKEMGVLRDNWRSAKSTAANYKKYTEEKDKFMTREIERMRMQYEGVIEKLRQKCKRSEGETKQKEGN